MDRSRLTAPGVEVVAVAFDRLAAVVAQRSAETGVDLVVVDLSRTGALAAAAELHAPVVGFAPHVDDELLGRAREAGVEALPRSQFFRRWPDLIPPSPQE